MNVFRHNSKAWDKNVESGDVWTKPVDKDVIEKAKKGEWGIVLTPRKPAERIYTE